MIISIDRTSPIPVYIQIRNSIRDMILSGEMSIGWRLPPERKMAEILGVNRSTVLNAYRELKADGFIDSHVGRGTVVVSQGRKDPANAPLPAMQLQWKQLFSDGAARMQEPMVRNLLELANREDFISFAAGIPAHDMDPLKELADLQEWLLKNYRHTALQHTPTEGLYGLRESISQLMKSRGMKVPPEELLVLSGSQQGLDLAARVFIDPGDVIVVEEPTFFCALQIFKTAGAKIMGVPVDREGIIPDILESLLMRYKPKLIYTMPTFHNPSGIVATLERRRQLLRLAYKYQVPIIEDDAYGGLRYEGEDLPTLKALDEYGYVIYLSTFSKVMFTGLRIGWLAASKPVVRQFALLKQMADLHSNSFGQCLIDAFLRKGLYERHLSAVRQENKRRRDIMLDALRKYAPDGVEWDVPEGGLYIWCSLPGDVRQSILLAKASERKVAFVPGEAFFTNCQWQNNIRLSFTSSAPDRIHEGIKRLMEAVKEVIDETEEAGAGLNFDLKPIL